MFRNVDGSLEDLNCIRVVVRRVKSTLLALVTTLYFMQFCESKYFLSISQVLARSMDLHIYRVNNIFIHNMLVVCPARRNQVIDEY